MNANHPPRSVLVTGVSTGIGYSAAQVFIERGLHVFGSVRKQTDCPRLEKDFGAALNGANLFGLVNNAGVAVSGPLAHMLVTEVSRQLEIYVAGALHVTQAFLPFLGMDPARSGGPGRWKMPGLQRK